jgi:transposase
MTDHHRFLQHIEFADAAIQDIDRNVTALITRMDQEVEAGQAPFQSLILLLMTIPGIDVLSARAILAEIGRDMSRFPTAGHLLSWAGLCPRNDESAGKRRSTRLRKGDLWLKTLLVQCACAARRKKDSYFNAQFLRLQGRRGTKKAACAGAASLLTTIYHMLRDGTHFRDLGAAHFDRRSKDLKAKRLITQLANLGFEAKLTPLLKQLETVGDVRQRRSIRFAVRAARPGSVRRGPCHHPTQFLGRDVPEKQRRRHHGCPRG